MIVTIILALFFSWSRSADKGAGTLLSATDPAYLSCTVWTGKEWTKPSAHSAKTPLIQSAKGVRAFAEVKVDSSCRNTTTLYIASGVEQKFRIVYTKLPSARDGNGIHIIGWSPSGEKLLAEVNLWEYETDLGFDHVALIYDAHTGSAKEVPTLNEALTRHFGSDCEFAQTVTGWRTNAQILVRVSRTPESEEYEQHFCVKEPRKFVYDLKEETIRAVRLSRAVD